MLVKEPQSVLCNVCEENFTTQTLEITDTKGREVSFPCCIRCRAVTRARLEYQREEVEAEALLVQGSKVHITEIIPDKEGRKAQDVRTRQTYQFVPSFTSRKKIETVIKQTQEVDENITKAFMEAFTHKS